LNSCSENSTGCARPGPGCATRTWFSRTSPGSSGLSGCALLAVPSGISETRLAPPKVAAVAAVSAPLSRGTLAPHTVAPDNHVRAHHLIHLGTRARPLWRRRHWRGRRALRHWRRAGRSRRLRLRRLRRRRPEGERGRFPVHDAHSGREHGVRVNLHERDRRDVHELRIIGPRFGERDALFEPRMSWHHPRGIRDRVPPPPRGQSPPQR